MTSVERDWSNELALRVGCREMGGWLQELGQWLGAPADFLPTRAGPFHELKNPAKGIGVQLHDPEPQDGGITSREAWVLYNVEIEAEKIKLPFDLDPLRDTPDRCRTKLSDNARIAKRLTTNDLKPSVTYYLDDARVVAVQFKRGLVGIQLVRLARLFDWPNWSDISK